MPMLSDEATDLGVVGIQDGHLDLDTLAEFACTLQIFERLSVDEAADHELTDVVQERRGRRF